jgi:predicted deacylase
MSTIQVGTAIAKPGSQVFGAIEVTNYPGGTSVSIPVIIIHGRKSGPVLWIDGCIHGDEPEGPLSIVALAQRLDPHMLRGTLVGIPTMNLLAFEAARRGNPLDPFAYDMNRIYPGGPGGRLTQRIAWAHKEALTATADLEISIHSGGSELYLSSTIFYGEDKASLELAKAMGKGWPLLLHSPHVSGSPLGAMLEKGKAAISIELGGTCSTLPGDLWANIDKMVEAFLNIMRHYDMIEGEAQYEGRWKSGVQKAVLADHSGLWVPERDMRFQEPMAEGMAVGRIIDLFGRELEEVKAPCEGEAFGLRTLPAVKTGEWVLLFAALDGVIE